jgi:ABC-2 type transport system permease protein
MNFKALVTKEFTEILRTYKIYVIPVIFLIFGLISPIIAKVMPELFESMVTEFTIEIPPPTWKDAFSQFFKNLTQMGILAVILTNIGIVADEKSRGTVWLVLSKPVSRHAFVLSKLVATLGLVLASLTLSYIACLYNTSVLFPDVEIGLTLRATLIFAVYMIFITSLTIFASTITSSNIAAGGISILGLFFISILPSLHRVFAEYSPGALTGMMNNIITGTTSFQDATWAMILTLIISIGLIILGSLVFSKQEL